MKRFFPRALPEAIGFLGLVVLLNGGCSEDQGVKPGAPVLIQLSILESGGSPVDITSDTPMCETGTASDAGTSDAGAATDAGATASDGGADAGATAATDGGADASAEAGAPAPMSIPDEPAATGAACDPKKHGVCKLDAANWCRCNANADDNTMGMWNCDPFAPTSVVIATFDRLLDTDPLDPGDGGQTSRDDIAMLTAMPTPAKPVSSATDYSSTGATSGSVFNALGPYYFMNYRSGGPSLQIGGAPALPTSSKVTITLDPTKVMAKDGKTAFTATGMLANGSLTFTTAAFQASIGVPTAPPPPPADGGADAAADGGASDGGATDAGASDAGASDALAIDALVSDAGTDIKVDAMTADAVASDASASDAASAPMATTGDAVPADMNMGEVTITFNNPVDMDVLAHIKITEDGKPFTAFITSDMFPAPDTQSFPMSKVAIRPMTMWAAGKTYVITVDGDAADVVGDKLGMGTSAAFMMKAN